MLKQVLILSQRYFLISDVRRIRVRNFGTRTDKLFNMNLTYIFFLNQISSNMFTTGLDERDEENAAEEKLSDSIDAIVSEKLEWSKTDREGLVSSASLLSLLRSCSSAMAKK